MKFMTQFCESKNPAVIKFMISASVWGTLLPASPCGLNVTLCVIKDRPAARALESFRLPFCRFKNAHKIAINSFANVSHMSCLAFLLHSIFRFSPSQQHKIKSFRDNLRHCKRSLDGTWKEYRLKIQSLCVSPIVRQRLHMLMMLR